MKNSANRMTPDQQQIILALLSRSAAKSIGLVEGIKSYIKNHSQIYNRDWKREQQHADRISAFFQDNPFCHEISEERINSLIASEIAAGISKTTINRRRAFLKARFNKLFEWNYNAPKIRTKLFKEDRKTVFFSDDQVRKLLKSRLLTLKRYSHLKAFIIIALNTGMRKEEVLSLEWGQVDLKLKIITLPKTKTGTTQQVYINAPLCKFLKAQKKEVGYVVNREGFRVKCIKHSFKHLVEKEGLYRPGICPHTLRHTYASKLVQEGVDLKTVQEAMRHSSITTTMRYSHISEKHLRDAIEKAGR